VQDILEELSRQAEGHRKSDGCGSGQEEDIAIDEGMRSGRQMGHSAESKQLGARGQASWAS